MNELMNRLNLMDCMKGMGHFPDKYFELAIVDPPYGIGMDGQKLSICKNPSHNRKEHKKKSWDNKIPDKKYFEELFRISQNQIIWGGNYFTEYIKPIKAWVIWDKGQYGLTMSDGEMAWTSFNSVTRIKKINRVELSKDGTIHPTQKPVALYRWLLQNYAKKGDKILDTHVGSGSSLIACWEEGFEYCGFELDEDYYKAACNRIEQVQAQGKLFATV